MNRELCDELIFLRGFDHAKETYMRTKKRYFITENNEYLVKFLSGTKFIWSFLKGFYTEHF